MQFACDNVHTARDFVQAAQTWVANYESKCSRFRPDSLVSQINDAAGRNWVEIDEEMERFLDLSGSIYEMSRGLLDVTALPLMRLWDYHSTLPRIPSAEAIAAARCLVGWPQVERGRGRVRLPEIGMALDFGSWLKEYAVDMVTEIAREHRITSALVDFGHDLRAIGSAPGKLGWPIGLEYPSQPGEPCWSNLVVCNRAVASSGDSRRGINFNGVHFGPIIDPRTGRPVAHNTRQVTVIAPNCVQAGMLATTAFILPPLEGIRFIHESMNAEGCILSADSRHQTRGYHHHVVHY